MADVSVGANMTDSARMTKKKKEKKSGAETCAAFVPIFQRRMGGFKAEEGKTFNLWSSYPPHASHHPVTLTEAVKKNCRDGYTA